jgi:RNA polymerase sigma-70 factor (ECF subfamily)
MKVWPPSRPLRAMTSGALAMLSAPAPVRGAARRGSALAMVRSPGAATAQPRLAGSARAPGRTDFASLYDDWFDHVMRWLRALGAPPADREDLAQEVFLVVRRRLGDFDHRNVAGWLYRIASRQVAAHRRRKWFKAVLSRQPAGDVAELELERAVDGAPSPAAALERKERRAILQRLLEKMPEKQRTTFVLFELEGYSGEEIAALLEIPVATVWTRLHHGRKQLFALVEALRQDGGLS